MLRRFALATALVLALVAASLAAPSSVSAPPPPVAPPLPAPATLDETGSCPGGLEAGAAARTVTPVGPDGRIWQEPFVDANGNGRYDAPNPLDPSLEFDPYTDENGNGKWDGPWMAGYGHDEDYYTARGVHDDVWARAVVLRCGDVSVAMVSLDVVGFFREEVLRVRDAVDDLGLTHLLVSSTHTHDSIDTMGLWGPNEATDGKDPRTQAHVRARTEEAVRAAHARLTPVTVRLGAVAAPIDFGFLQTDLRDPFVIDDVILAMQLARKDGHGTEATIVNWSPHPETMAGTDDLISSDFAHTLRGCIEGTSTSVPCVVRGKHYPGFGGTAVYFSGAVGGMMTTLRTRVFDEHGARIPDYTYEKHERIGEVAAAAAMDALAARHFEEITTLRVQARELYVQADNVFLLAVNALGVFDHPQYFAPGVESPAIGPLGNVIPAPYIRTEVNAVALGPADAPRAEIVTVPGELLPEIAVGGYLAPTDECWGFDPLKAAHGQNGGRARIAAANPQVPTEPILRDHMRGEFKFLFGLANDELGYLVPANDFTPPSLYPVFSDGTDRCGDSDHYEETVSLGKYAAPTIANALAAMVDPRFVPAADPNARLGFVDSAGNAQAIPNPATTRGVWLDSNLNGAYEENEDGFVTLGEATGFTGAWGFLGSNGEDLGSDPAALAGDDPRGIWVDANGDGAYTPGLDGALFADAGPLGDRALDDLWP